MREQIFTVLFFVLLLLGALTGIWLLRRWQQDWLRFQLQERKLRDLERSMELITRQNAEFSQQLEQMRKIRHDLRHHETMLRMAAQHGDMDALEDYFQSYSGLHLDTPLRYCGNAAVDALAQQYLGAAEADGVSVDALLEVGEEVGISTPDLCVVLGNCLENAVEALRRTPGDSRFIRLRVLETQGWLSIVQENSCPPGALQGTEAGYLSSKAEGRIGIGLMSVRAVAEQYGGMAVYQKENGKFRTSVILFKRDETT